MTQLIYRIIVEGNLDKRRSQWFDGWTITQKGDGTTLLSGLIADQAALHGTLTKIHNLNLPIISVECEKKT